MGEIANSLINGDFDFYTGEYIGRGKGFPRTHDKSLPWEKSTLRKSEDLTWRKVIDFIKSNGIKHHLHPEVIKSYGVSYKGRHPLRNACFEILKDFDKFKKFINGKYKK